MRSPGFREWPALAHRQKPGDRIDFAVGQDDARYRAVTKLPGFGMKLRRCDQLLAQIGRRIDQKPVISIGADRNRSLGAPEFGMFGSRRQANRTSAIPLRNTTTGRDAQDDDAKHDPSPGDSKYFEGGRRHDHDPTIGNVSRLEVHLRSRRDAVALAYLRAAHAYMLISMPTGTSTIFGVFQAILALSFFNFFNRTDSALADKLVRNEKFASEIFFTKSSMFMLQREKNL